MSINSSAKTLQKLMDVAAQVIDLTRAAGCNTADVLASRSTDFEVKVADGQIVTLTQATSKGLGLRVFKNGRLGFCHTSDFSGESLKGMVERALQLAEQSAADPFNGLADLSPGHLQAGDALDLFDPKILELAVEEKIRWAHAIEDVARQTDARVRKFRDSGVATGVSQSVLLTTTGASRASQNTGISLWCTPVAQAGDELQTEMWYDSQSHLSDLEPLELIGRTAAKRAARMLGARPIKTQKIPVIFEPMMAGGLFAGMLGALDGDMVFKKASFLANHLHESIATHKLTLIDDPHLTRGAASTLFDSEGVPTKSRRIIDQGKLTSFLYDTYTARKAGVNNTANAQRGYSSLPHIGPFNLYVEAGEISPEQIWSKYPRALVVTRGLGQGVNAVTGEYSRGANGLYVENGEIIHPVQEITIAANFLDMLRNIDAIGSDLRLRGSVGSPTVCVGDMAIGGT